MDALVMLRAPFALARRWSSIGPRQSRATRRPILRFPSRIYEDEDLLVLDKPAGVVVHPARGHATGTLVNGLLARGTLRTDGVDRRPGIVHRLDKGTSGLLVVAKTDQAREALQGMFARHEMGRVYVAIVAGHAVDATYDTLHGRHPTDRLRFTTRVARGKRAVTHVRVLERLLGGRATLVECRLDTGRTHQIRVHLAEVAKTPILGDPVYAKKPRDADLASAASSLGHQALHAARLAFVHPRTGQPLSFHRDPRSSSRLRCARCRRNELLVTHQRGVHEAQEEERDEPDQDSEPEGRETTRIIELVAVGRVTFPKRMSWPSRAPWSIPRPPGTGMRAPASVAVA